MLDSAKQPWSVVTAASYPLVGVWPLVEHPGPITVMLWIALFLLMLGTGAHHWTGLSDRKGQDLDHIGMNSVYLMLATLAIIVFTGGSYLWLVAALVVAVIIDLVADFPNKSLMGGCVFLALVGGVGAGNPNLAIAGFMLMGTGYLYQSGSDMEHGLGWHNLTALGTSVMMMALLG